MKRAYIAVVALTLVFGLALNDTFAQTPIPFADELLAPGASGATEMGSISDALDAICIEFDWGEDDGMGGLVDATDFSWSQDITLTVTDPSGDVVVLGDGVSLGFTGDIDWHSAGGEPGSSTAAGSFADVFTIAELTGVAATFGEAGTYSAFFTDGWTGGSADNGVYAATVTLKPVPEPTTALSLLLGLLGLAALKRR